MKTKEDLIEDLDEEIARCKAKIAEFSINVVKSPVYTLEWSATVFEAAGKLEIFETAKKQLLNGADVESLKKYAQNRAIDIARYPQYSTSQQSNLMHAQSGVAAVCLMEMIGE